MAGKSYACFIVHACNGYIINMIHAKVYISIYKIFYPIRSMGVKQEIIYLFHDDSKNSNNKLVDNTKRLHASFEVFLTCAILLIIIKLTLT